MPLEQRLPALLALPRAQQRTAVETLLRDLAPDADDEAWNTRFGPDSLFDAWTQTTVARGVHTGLREALRPHLDAAGKGWTAVEIGGGDGRLWRELLRDDDEGTLVVIDPVDEVHARIGAALPPRVALESFARPVEACLELLPPADAVVCSLTLHHVAGADTHARAACGLPGPGKLEILRALADALRPRRGLGLLAEADVHCDLELAPGDPLLADRLLDSYVRRCAASIADDLRRAPTHDAALRWRAILRRWCLEQVAMADVPYADRDVYELDVPRWEALLERAGLEVVNRRFTDDYRLFVRYVLEAR